MVAESALDEAQLPYRLRGDAAHGFTSGQHADAFPIMDTPDRFSKEGRDRDDFDFG